MAIMIPLTAAEPALSAERLSEAMHQGLSQALTLPPDVHVVVLENLTSPGPIAERLAITLDGAKADTEGSTIRPPRDLNEMRSAFRANEFALSADPIFCEGTPLTARIRASHVAFDFRKAGDGQWWLAPSRENAEASGSVEISVTQEHLSELIRTVADRAGTSQGIGVEKCRLSIEKESDDTLRFAAEIAARKMIMRTRLKLTGLLRIASDLRLRFSELRLIGDGMLGNMASSILQPHLRKLESREYSLADLPLGEIRISNLEIVSTEPLMIRGKFGG